MAKKRSQTAKLKLKIKDYEEELERRSTMIADLRSNLHREVKEKSELKDRNYELSDDLEREKAALTNRETRDGEMIDTLSSGLRQQQELFTSMMADQLEDRELHRELLRRSVPDVRRLLPESEPAPTPAPAASAQSTETGGQPAPNSK